MILIYTLPQFTDEDEMYFPEESEREPKTITFPIYNDDDELIGVDVRYIS